MTFHPRPARRRMKQCGQCGALITWATRKAQYGRLVRRGLTPERVNALLLCCPKCATATLREGEPGPTSALTYNA
jgi:hypothetical protein